MTWFSERRTYTGHDIGSTILFAVRLSLPDGHDGFAQCCQHTVCIGLDGTMGMQITSFVRPSPGTVLAVLRLVLVHSVCLCFRVSASASVALMIHTTGGRVSQAAVHGVLPSLSIARRCNKTSLSLVVPIVATKGPGRMEFNFLCNNRFHCVDW